MTKAVGADGGWLKSLAGQIFGFLSRTNASMANDSGIATAPSGSLLNQTETTRNQDGGTARGRR